jgi:hypothetical protein
MNPILIAAAVLLLPKLIGEKVAANDLQFNPIGVKKKDGKLNVIVEVTNPRGTTISIDGVFLTMFLQLGEDNKSKIGAITIPREKAFKIEKKGVSTIYLPITLAGLGLVGLTAKIIKFRKQIASGEIKPKVIVTGTVSTMGIIIPITKTVPLDVNI